MKTTTTQVEFEFRGTATGNLLELSQMVDNTLDPKDHIKQIQFVAFRFADGSTATKRFAAHQKKMFMHEEHKGTLGMTIESIEHPKRHNGIASIKYNIYTGRYYVSMASFPLGAICTILVNVVRHQPKVAKKGFAWSEQMEYA